MGRLTGYGPMADELNEVPVPVPGASRTSLLVQIDESPIYRFPTPFRRRVVETSSDRFYVQVLVHVLVLPGVRKSADFVPVPDEGSGTAVITAEWVFPSYTPMTASVVRLSVTALAGSVAAPGVPRGVRGIVDR